MAGRSDGNREKREEKSGIIRGKERVGSRGRENELSANGRRKCMAPLCKGILLTIKLMRSLKLRVNGDLF